MSNHSESASVHRASNSGGPARSRGISVADCSKGTSVFTGKSNKELGDFTASNSADNFVTKPIAKTSPAAPVDIPSQEKTPSHIPANLIKSKLLVLSSGKDNFTTIKLEDVPQKDGPNDDLKDWVRVSKKDLGLKDDVDKENQDAEKPEPGKKPKGSDSWNVITYLGDTRTDSNWPRPFGQR